MRRTTLIIALAGAALVALLASGCGGSTSGSEPVATNQVDLPPSYRFEPKAITVTAGATVTWTNNDHFTHNVKVADGDTMEMKPGESVSYTFDSPGTYGYTCTFHPHDMTGTVVVTAP